MSAQEKENTNVKLKVHQAYGQEALEFVETQTEDHISASNLERLSQTFCDQEVKISPEDINTIQDRTVDQSACEAWKEERQKRLTASNARRVVKRKPVLKVGPIVKDMLFSSFRGNRYTKYGLAQEKPTIADYIERKRQENIRCCVEPIGLCIDPDHPWLACSPDGLVRVLESEETESLIESKNLLKDKGKSLHQGCVSKEGNFCLELVKGSLRLKRTHNFYVQCLSTLDITRKTWIDFVARTTSPHSLHIERIFPSPSTWSMWLPKLKAFYFKCLLPALALQHQGLGGIREPGLWVSFLYRLHSCP